MSLTWEKDHKIKMQVDAEQIVPGYRHSSGLSLLNLDYMEHQTS